ncbi:MAG: helix-turn-helix domain-containing protein [Roseiflexaceae bacterium]|nr:helix-turn-helix domain-containing protein [Roseiflexaceae bacterium]
MRNPIPPITETVDELKLRLQQERDGRKKPRLQMLYLLATGQARERQEVAALLGVHRNTVGRWLALYAAGGLAALLAIRTAPGKPLSLSPVALAAVEQALHQPVGFASYEALRQWLRDTHQIDIKYKTLYTIVRTRFKAKLKVPRPSHQKKP